MFQGILAEMPGELAPQQAVARVFEVGGHLDEARRLYDAVSRADASFTSAAFGLARCCERLGDRDGAIEAYRRVPSTGGSYVPAQMALARTLLRPDTEERPQLADLVGGVRRHRGRSPGSSRASRCTSCVQRCSWPPRAWTGSPQRAT